MSSTETAKTIKGRFAAAARKSWGHDRQQLPYNIFVPDWGPNGSPSIEDAAEKLRVALEDLRQAVIAREMAGDAKTWVERGDQDIAERIVHPQHYRPTWKASAERFIKQLAGGAFTDTSYIVEYSGRLFGNGEDKHIDVILNLYKFLSTDAQEQYKDEGLAVATRQVQEAAYGYIVQLACTARSPYELRSILACIDEEQYKLSHIPYGHKGHEPPADIEEYDANPEAWKKKHWESSYTKILTPFIFHPEA